MVNLSRSYGKVFEDKSFVVDRLHITGHTDEFCRDVCHPDKVPSMKGVINTMVCEQTNSDVGCYKNSTKHMNCARYNFFFFILFDFFFILFEKSK